MNNIMYRVIVDIAPKTISGTNGCYKYVYGEYKTKKEAKEVASNINECITYMGMATVEKVK